MIQSLGMDVVQVVVVVLFDLEAVDGTNVRKKWVLQMDLFLLSLGDHLKQRQKIYKFLWMDWHIWFCQHLLLPRWRQTFESLS